QHFEPLAHSLSDPPAGLPEPARPYGRLILSCPSSPPYPKTVSSLPSRPLAMRVDEGCGPHAHSPVPALPIAFSRPTHTLRLYRQAAPRNSIATRFTCAGIGHRAIVGGGAIAPP